MDVKGNVESVNTLRKSRMNVEPEEEDGWLFAHYATSHTKERQQKKAESKLIRQRR